MKRTLTAIQSVMKSSVNGSKTRMANPSLIRIQIQAQSQMQRMLITFSAFSAWNQNSYESYLFSLSLDLLPPSWRHLWMTPWQKSKEKSKFLTIFDTFSLDCHVIELSSQKTSPLGNGVIYGRTLDKKKWKLHQSFLPFVVVIFHWIRSCSSNVNQWQVWTNVVDDLVENAQILKLKIHIHLWNIWSAYFYFNLNSLN